jgi:hypothetical protein
MWAKYNEQMTMLDFVHINWHIFNEIVILINYFTFFIIEINFNIMKIIIEQPK